VRQRLAPGGLYVTWLDSRVGDRGADIMVETVTRAFDHCGLAHMSGSYLLLLCSDRPITAHHPLAVAQQEQLSAYLRDEHGIDPASLPYLLLNTNAATLRNPGGAPVNTLDKPVLEFEMARLTARNIKELQQRIVENIKPAELASAFRHFDWSLASMVQALPRIVGTNPYYQTLFVQLKEARGHSPSEDTSPLPPGFCDAPLNCGTQTDECKTFVAACNASMQDREDCVQGATLICFDIDLGPGPGGLFD